jgi:hypothetical protein
MFYCADTDSVDLSPKVEAQEQRGLTLYTLASKFQMQKTRSNPYMGYMQSYRLLYPSAS